MARMKVKVIGCAKRKVGADAKTGELYDYQKFAFSYINQWGDADLAIVSVDTDVIQRLGVSVGKTYDASVISTKVKTYIDLLEEVPE